MSPDTIRHQAEAFINWSERAGLPRAEAWRRWSSGKAFAAADADAIYAEVLRVRAQRSVEAFVRRQPA